MPITCFYIDGFHNIDLARRPNGLSSWLGPLKHEGDSVLTINARFNKADTLKSRWHRLKRALNGKPRNIYILSYSIGCHLAVKLASQRSIARWLQELILIAPDPKFQKNQFDRLEGQRSAYNQVKDVWEPKSSGEQFSKQLNEIAKRCRTFIVYSAADPVAVFPRNVEKLVKRCPYVNNLNVMVNGLPATDSRFRIELRPDQAECEAWIHAQLFTNLECLPLRDDVSHSG
jgi:predicted alpha/beta hydrolase family esterase